jgi:hypothetical protein
VRRGVFLGPAWAFKNITAKQNIIGPDGNGKIANHVGQTISIRL